MTISPEEHDFISEVVGDNVAKSRPNTLRAKRASEAESAWLESQAFAAYGASEDIQETFYMGWDAAMARIAKGGGK